MTADPVRRFSIALRIFSLFFSPSFLPHLPNFILFYFCFFLFQRPKDWWRKEKKKKSTSCSWFFEYISLMETVENFRDHVNSFSCALLLHVLLTETLWFQNGTNSHHSLQRAQVFVVWVFLFQQDVCCIFFYPYGLCNMNPYLEISLLCSFAFLVWICLLLFLMGSFFFFFLLFFPLPLQKTLGFYPECFFNVKFIWRYTVLVCNPVVDGLSGVSKEQPFLFPAHHRLVYIGHCVSAKACWNCVYNLKCHSFGFWILQSQAVIVWKFDVYIPLPSEGK